MCGYLELIIGPMFSGKTSRLHEIYRKAHYCNANIFVLNHSIDTRYSTDAVVNHNNERIPCVNYSTIRDFITNQIDPYVTSDKNIQNSVILINEGQFFTDIKECVIELVEKFGCKVYVCGLDGDFKRTPFGNFLDLIPYSNNVVKLNSLCMNCKNGTEAPFTCRHSSKNEKQIMVGSDESYIPVCRKCYIAFTKTIHNTS
jgi:thymidine kinase